MKSFIKKKIKNLVGYQEIKKKNDIILKNLGLINFKINKESKSNNIEDFEFQIFSQYGDDGIILFLVDNIKIHSKKFIEFGVENYEEANTRFLLESFNWEGLVIDSNIKHINDIKKENYYWRNKLSVDQKFITKDNINSIIQENKFSGKIGILSIDIDGNDYWIWNEIDTVDPSIVIVEYNARFGSDLSVTIPYEKSFNRNKNNIYYGASLNALYKLGRKKNYSLVCTNSNGNNAYFVKNDHFPKDHNLIKPRTPKECFNFNSFKELKDKQNNFLNLSREEEFNIINKFKLTEV